MCSKDCECKFKKYKELLGLLRQVQILKEDLGCSADDDKESILSVLNRRDELVDVANLEYDVAEAVMKGDYSDCDDDELVEVINIMEHLNSVETSNLKKHLVANIMGKINGLSTGNSQDS
jgi:hypothetical protein